MSDWQISPWNGQKQGCQTVTIYQVNVGFLLPCARMRSGGYAYIWSHRFMCMYYVAKKIGAIYCSLIEFNRQKRSLLCQVICSEKEIWRHSINGMRKGFPENCITVSYASSTCTAASYAMLLQLQCRHHYRYSLYWQCLARTGYVFCGVLVCTRFWFNSFHCSLTQQLQRSEYGSSEKNGTALGFLKGWG